MKVLFLFCILLLSACGNADKKEIAAPLSVPDGFQSRMAVDDSVLVGQSLTVFISTSDENIQSTDINI